jgi:hypothetical protein
MFTPDCEEVNKRRQARALRVAALAGTLGITSGMWWYASTLAAPVPPAALAMSGASAIAATLAAVLGMWSLVLSGTDACI